MYVRLFLNTTLSMTCYLTQTIMIESEGITENVKSWRTDAISAITSSLPADKIMQVSIICL